MKRRRLIPALAAAALTLLGMLVTATPADAWGGCFPHINRDGTIMMVC